jgi:hypothetical protein
MRILAALLLSSSLLSCATQTPAQCRERADEAYRQCANPTFIPESSMNEPTRADDAQLCRSSHMQAIERCEEKPKAPTPEIRPDAG